MSLNLNLALILEKCHVFKSSLVIFGFLFQDWWNFGIPHWKSCSRQKNEWEKYPICWNWQKVGHFQAISRVPENFWKFPGMIKLWSSGLKIKFLDINWVELTPYMLNSVKTSQFQGISGTLLSWIPWSRNHKISLYVCKINTNMLHRVVFWRFHQKNTFFWKRTYFPGKPLIRKKTKSIDELIFTRKFFSAKRQSCYF